VQYSKEINGHTNKYQNEPIYNLLEHNKIFGLISKTKHKEKYLKTKNWAEIITKIIHKN